MSNNHKWFHFTSSLVNLEHVMRIFTGKDKPTLTIEFLHNGLSEYEFNSIHERDQALELIWNLINN